MRRLSAQAAAGDRDGSRQCRHGTKRRPARSFAVMTGSEGALLPILHALQDAFGYVPGDAVPLDRRRAEPHARRSARRRHLLSRLPRQAGRPARAEALPRRGLPVDGRRRACRSRCANASASTGARPRADGAVTLEPVYCLGLCAVAPVGHARRRADRPARRAASIDAIARRCGDDRASSSRAMPPRWRVGADAVAARDSRRSASARLDVEIVRTGSRGLFWLEPLVEVETPAGRIAYRAGDGRRTSPACSTPACSSGGRIRCALGRPEDIPVPASARRG